MSLSMMLGHHPMSIDFATRLGLAWALCKDPKHNFRDLESPWYAVWEIILTDLISGTGLILSPQYCILPLPSDSDHSTDGEGEPKALGSPSSQLFELTYDPTSNHELPPSRFSSANIPAHLSLKSRTPDFSLLSISGSSDGETWSQQLEAQFPHPITTPSFNNLLETFLASQPTLSCVVTVIIENKRGSSTHGWYIPFAKTCVLDQAKFLFSVSSQASVIAVATSGELWCWAKVIRNPNKPVSSTSEKEDPTYHSPSKKAVKPFLAPPVWSPNYTLGRRDSAEGLLNLFRSIVAVSPNHGVGYTEDDDEANDTSDGHNSGSDRSHDDVTNRASDVPSGIAAHTQPLEPRTPPKQAAGLPLKRGRVSDSPGQFIAGSSLSPLSSLGTDSPSESPVVRPARKKHASSQATRLLGSQADVSE